MGSKAEPVIKYSHVSVINMDTHTKWDNQDLKEPHIYSVRL